MSLLENALITVLNMSITATYTAIAVIFARMMLHKAPKVFSYALWSVVFFRLVCPFSFSAAFSLLGLIYPAPTGSPAMVYLPHDTGMQAAPKIDTGMSTMPAAFNASLPAATPLAGANPMQVWLTIGTLVWLSGIAVLLIYAATSYLRLKKQIRTATLVAANVYETDLIRTPFVCGLVKPKIYLPLNLTGREREYILCHERTHIQRLDYLVKPVAFFALALHWFNPVMWLCYALMTKDMEMSCDERVIHQTAGAGVTDYSGTLLALATRKNLSGPSPLAFGESNVKARIKNILKYQKPALWVIAAATAAVIILAVVLTANPLQGVSIYEHPDTFLGQNSVRAPAMVRIIDHRSGEAYLLTEANEIAPVTAIVEDMRISRKEMDQARGGSSGSRYTIFYYDRIHDSLTEYSYAVHAAPVWIDNNVKPSYRYRLMNQEDIFRRLAEVLAGQTGEAAYDVDSLMKNKTRYIGDNSRVVALIDALPLPPGVTRGTVALATAKPPYGVTIHYSLAEGAAPISEEQFLRNSVLLFALIDNADTVQHIGYWPNQLLSSNPFRFTYTRADAEKIVGGDVRQFAKDQASLAELTEIVQMLRAGVR